jgi:hypothetical protein
MECQETGGSCCYLIDGKDRIVHVSDTWLEFARENEAAESCHPDKILNQSLWDFIDGIETRHLYEIVLEKIRRTRRSVRLPFRCDAPDKRRYLELRITAAQNDTIEFSSTVLREEARDTVELLKADIPRSEEFLKICSMCKKVEVTKNFWLDAEAAIAALRLFENSKLPKISHGLCRECFRFGLAEIDRL